MSSNEPYRRNIQRLQALLKEGGYDDAVVGEAQAIAGAKGEYLAAAFDAIKKEYGSVENYIHNHLGVSDEALIDPCKLLSVLECLKEHLLRIRRLFPDTE